MLGISLKELLLILLLMVIFLKPKDIPSVINFIAMCWKKIKSFTDEVRSQIQTISNELDDVKETTYKSFQEQVDEVRLELEKNNPQNIYEEMEDNFTPKLDIKLKSKLKSQSITTKKKKK